MFRARCLAYLIYWLVVGAIFAWVIYESIQAGEWRW